MKEDKNSELLGTFMEYLYGQKIPINDEEYLVTGYDLADYICEVFGFMNDSDIMDKIIELMYGQNLIVNVNKGPDIGYVAEEFEIASREDFVILLKKDVEPNKVLVW